MPSRNQYDGAWKNALHRYLRPFLALFFPHVETDVDWSHAPEFLDREMQQIARGAKVGRRHVDLLVRLRRTNGEVRCILLHVEVQGQHDEQFEWRMWVYHYRVHDRYGPDVASLAVLADADPIWRPDSFRKSTWGCQLEFRFPIVKLADYRERSDELEQSENPFAILVAAYLSAQTTKPARSTRSWMRKSVG